MLSLSPHLFQNLGWQIEEDMINELHYEDSLPSYNPKETDTSCQSLSFSPPHPDIEIDDQQNSSTTKKLSHNAYERDRRKKLNYLYSSLRSLLPETDRTKKLSIPCTIARVLKYIPELQRHVERLMRRKEEIQSRSSKEVEAAHLAQKSLVHPAVSVTNLNKREVMIQICVFSNSTRFRFSRVLRILEGEGLHLLNASSSTNGGDKTFYTLHLQAKRATSMEGQSFYEHIMNICKEQGRGR